TGWARSSSTMLIQPTTQASRRARSSGPGNRSRTLRGGAPMILRRRVRGIFAILATLAVAATASAPVAQSQPRFEWPEKARNLKVLPKNTPKEKLSATMIGFTRALGVRCPFCHVGQEGQPLTTYDFVSDQKPTKNI